MESTRKNTLGIRKNVMEFYDKIGWQKKGKDVFTDTERYEDLRPVSREYINKCHLRINRYIKREGSYILDAGSGPVQYPEFLTYSSNYDYRVCVDFSITALQGARKKLRERGIYILADLANLPLKSNSMDAAVSLHTIYHLPQEEQSRALQEIYRTLKPGSTGVVVYSWGNHSLLMRAAFAPQRTIRKMKKILRLESPKLPVRQSEPELYFYAHTLEWFNNEVKQMFDYTIASWRCVSTLFLQTYIHELTFGRQLLCLVYSLENIFPRFFGKFGQYPMFIIKK